MTEGILHVRRWSQEAAMRIFFALAECGGEPLGFFRVQRSAVNGKVRSLAVRVRLPERNIREFERYAKVGLEPAPAGSTTTCASFPTTTVRTTPACLAKR